MVLLTTRSAMPHEPHSRLHRAVIGRTLVRGSAALVAAVHRRMASVLASAPQEPSGR